MTENGRTRSITKLQASVTQLTNKAASGDPRAIHELLYWSKILEDSVQAALPAPVPHERDSVGHDKHSRTDPEVRVLNFEDETNRPA